MAKASKNLNDALAVGSRLIHSRKRLGLSQTDFALKAGIGRERLASYESGRVMLPWKVGLSICSAHNINPGWLAEGFGSWRPFFLVGQKEVPERASFVDIYDSIPQRHQMQSVLAISAVAEFGVEFEKSLAAADSDPVSQRQAFSNTINAVEMLFDMLNPDERKAFAVDFIKLSEKYIGALIKSLAPKGTEREPAQRETSAAVNQRFAFGQIEPGHSLAVDDLERSVRWRRERARIVLTLEALQKMEKPPPSLFRTVPGHDKLREVRIASLRLLGFQPSPGPLVFVSVFSIGGGKKTPPSEIENATQRLNVASAIPTMALEELHAKFSRDANYQRAYEAMRVRIALGLHCRALREEARLGKEELARTLGLTTWFLSEFESGDQSDPKVAATIIGHFSEGLRSRGVDPTGCLSAFDSAAAPTPSPSPEQRSATIPTGRGQMAPTTFGRAVTVKEDASTGH